MKQITRKRALELAQECIQVRMDNAYQNAMRGKQGLRPYSKHTEESEALYAELAAALAYIENLSRQKELL